jgi:putative membrane protein
LVIGLALLAVIGWRQGGPVLLAALAASAAPAAGASAYRLVSLALYARGWQALLPPRTAPEFSALWRLRWIGEAVNGLLPVAQVGGDLARARLVAALGVDAADAAASMLADLAVGTLTQVPFAAAGVAALAAMDSAGGAQPAGWAAVHRLAAPIIVGIATVAAAGSALFVLMRLGLEGPLRRLPLWSRLARRWGTLAGGVAKLDQAMAALTRRPRDLLVASLWHLAGWFSHVGETWLVLWMLGAPVSWPAALAIESLSSTVRGAAFFVPGGIGVQEGAIIFVCHLLGVPTEPSLALSLAKRLRELVLGAPGLALWAIAERHLLKRSAARLWSCRDA